MRDLILTLPTVSLAGYGATQTATAMELSGAIPGHRAAITLFSV